MEYTVTSQTKTFRTAPQTRIRILLLGMLMALAATFAVTTWAQPAGGMGGGMGMHGHHGGGMMGSPEGMARMLDHMLDGLNATDDQRAQIKQIAQAAASDLRTQREASRGLHERAMQIFTAPNIDAAAAETLRQQMVAQHDLASKRTMQAMVDMARVLTPDQRAKIGQRMKDRMDRMDRMHQQRMQMSPSASQPRQ
jgi:Spy/CpxP family protein refolding chaperone